MQTHENQFIAQHPQHHGCNPACNACHYKNIPYQSQLGKKQAWAKKQFPNWSEQLNAIIQAPPEERLGYRHKSWLRLNTQGRTQDQEVSFGMFRSVLQQGDWTQEFISWDTCPIHAPGIQRIIQGLKESLKGASSVSSIVGIWMGTPHLVIVSNQPCVAEFQKLDWPSVLAPPFHSVWFHENPQVGMANRRIFGHRPITQIHGPQSDTTASHPILAFRQVAQTLLHQARAQGLRFLLETHPDLLLDLYCGTGELSLALPDTIDWIGLDASKSAIQFANTLRPQARLQKGYTGFVEHRLRDPRVAQQLYAPSYALWLNPPRSGLSPEARSTLANLFERNLPTRIAYLSCSASRLARDLHFFEQSDYRVKLLQPFDFFPQTEHFETLALLELAPS